MQFPAIASILPILLAASLAAFLSLPDKTALEIRADLAAKIEFKLTNYPLPNYQGTPLTRTVSTTSHHIFCQPINIPSQPIESLKLTVPPGRTWSCAVFSKDSKCSSRTLNDKSQSAFIGTGSKQIPEWNKKNKGYEAFEYFGCAVVSI